MTSYIVFMAALTMAVGQDNVYHRCRNSSISDNSRFTFSCNAGRTIIVKSAIVGATDIFMPPEQCPITNNTCLKEITIVAELCTGRNSCEINQNILLYNESKLSCPRNGDAIGNFITVNYTCIYPDKGHYGDICHFDGDLYSNSEVYISSFRNFPDAMGPEVNYQCSCMFTSRVSLLSANVTIRALLVKLTGAATCSEGLSITDSGGDTKLAFCSPCNNANNFTTVPLASDPVISFWRGRNVSPFNGKFILEITVSSVSSESGSTGSMKCGYVGSTNSSSTISPRTIPSSMSSSILSQSGKLTSADIPNTVSTNAQQGVLSSAKPVSQTQITARSISTGAIVGIVLGVFGFLAFLSLAIVFVTKSIRSKRNGAQSTELMPSASDPRLDRSSVDKNPQYETTIKGNGLQVNQPKISSQVTNMQGNQDPPDHSYYNESISNIKPLSDNHDHYEPLKVTNNQHQTYYNQPSENGNYQPLNFS